MNHHTSFSISSALVIRVRTPMATKRREATRVMGHPARWAATHALSLRIVLGNLMPAK
jgi:hypothetical protein